MELVKDKVHHFLEFYDWALSVSGKLHNRVNILDSLTLYSMLCFQNFASYAIRVDTQRLYNVTSMSMQRHNFASTFIQHCLKVACLLGLFLKVLRRMADSVDPDQTFLWEQSDLGLHYSHR